MCQAVGSQAGRWARLAVLASLVVGGGCSSLSPTERGIIGGGTLGAIAGTGIGMATGNPEAGAVIGAGLGGIGGGLLGSEIERSERRAAYDAQVRQAAAQRPAPTLTEIAQLAQQGVGDSVIIQQVRLSGAQYNLSSDQIIWLKQQGVSDNVIQEMQATAMAPPPVVRRAPAVVYEPAPIIYHRPRPWCYHDCWGPPPPPRIGIGFVIGGKGHHHGHHHHH